jgi:hypothetical protein
VTYTRAPQGFKERLAGIADRSQSLSMARLADSLRKSLTPNQQIHVATFLSPAGGDVLGMAELTVSQRNAVLVLVVANEIEVLRKYFKGEL